MAKRKAAPRQALTSPSREPAKAVTAKSATNDALAARKGVAYYLGEIVRIAEQWVEDHNLLNGDVAVQPDESDGDGIRFDSEKALHPTIWLMLGTEINRAAWAIEADLRYEVLTAIHQWQNAIRHAAFRLGVAQLNAQDECKVVNARIRFEEVIQDTLRELSPQLRYLQARVWAWEEVYGEESAAKEMVAASNQVSENLNDPRDKWIYEQAMARMPWENLERAFKPLAAKENWRLLTGTNSFKAAANRYAERHRMDVPPKRANGRPRRARKPT